MPIARQYVGKSIPATHLHATVGRLLQGNGTVNTLFNKRRRCFPWDLRQLEGELSRVLEMAAQGDSEEMARRELGCDKKTSRVISSDSETVINPLPGYD
jgi:hypothetical protein